MREAATDSMNKKSNPFESPSHESVSSTESPEESKQLSLANTTLVLLWLVALLCIPVMMYFEESIIQNRNPDFRLGWIFLAPFMAAMLLPWFARTSLRRRAVYFFISIAAIVATLLLTIIIMVMLFGFAAT